MPLHTSFITAEKIGSIPISGGAAESAADVDTTFGAVNIGGLFGSPASSTGGANQFVLPAIILAVVVLGVFALRRKR